MVEKKTLKLSFKCDNFIALDSHHPGGFRGVGPW